MLFRRWWPEIALLGIAAAAFGPVWGAGFCPWDDRLYTLENPLVREGFSFSAAARSFTTAWENNWSPVFWIFLSLQVSLAGGVSPAVFHAVSVLLCLGNVLLLAGVARRYGLKTSAVLAATAVFALHPLMVEAVAWISAQKHLLAAAFLLIALGWDQEAERRKTIGPRALSLVAFSLSLMCSQIGVGLPVFLFFRAAGRNGDVSWMEAGRRVAGYFLLAGVAALGTLWVNWRPEAQAVAWFDHPAPHRVLHSLGALGWQAAAGIWPAKLAAFYPWPGSAIALYAAPGAALLLAVAGYAWSVRLRGGLPLAGVLGGLACFVPVSGLVPLPITFTADRLMYVPAVFLTLAGAAGLDRVVRRGRRWPLAACGFWALVLAGLTFRQAGFWTTERSLVNRTLRHYPESVPAQINAAVLDGLDGKKEEALGRFRELRAAHPETEVVWSNEMTLLRESGRTSEAVAVGRQAVETIPASLPLRFQYAQLLEEAGQNDEALEHWLMIREARPHSVQPAYHCARLLVARGEVKRALPLLLELELSLQGDPAYWDIRREAHDRNGDWQQAARAREAAEILRARKKDLP